MIGIFKLLSFLVRCARSLRFSRWLIAIVIATGVISGLASAGFVGVINEVVHADPADQAVRQRHLWIFVGLCLALPIFRFASTVLLQRLVQRVLYDLRLRLCRQVMAAPLSDLEQIGPGRLLATLTQDIDTIVGSFGNIPMLILQATVVIGCLSYLGYLSPVLLLMVLAFVVIGVVSYQLPLIKAQSRFRQMREALDKLFQNLHGLTEGTKELKIHAGRRESFLREELEPSALALRRYSVTGDMIYAAANSWGQTIFFVAIGLVLFAGSRFTLIETQTLSGFAFAILYMMTPLDVILNTLPGLSRAVESVRKVESLGLSLDGDGVDADASKAPPAPPPWKLLELRGVTLSYPGDSADDLFSIGPIDLTIEPGELVFLVGGNGSGKTTLAKILIGLYRPDEGAIELDGQAITDTDRDTYRQLFSVVFSDFFLFESLLGIDQQEIDGRALKYLQQLHLEQKVEVVDGRFSTVDLSQGQRKRLALLTAYLENRSIYLFDEWAADQDPVFKKIFYHVLLPELRARGKTVLVISHDDHYYGAADRVIKLDYGKVEFDGPAEVYLREAPVIGAVPGI